MSKIIKITQKQFADGCGVSRQAVGKAVKKGLLKVDANRKVILTHSSTKLYIEKQVVNQKSPDFTKFLNPNDNITQKEFAKLCGVTPQAVGKAVKAGLIKTDKKRKINLTHSVTKLYIKSQKNNQKKANQSTKTTTPQKKTDKKKPKKQIDKEIKAASSEEKKTTTEVIDLVALQREKTIEEIGRIKAERQLKELKLQHERETLIKKDTIGMVLFQYLDALNLNMLNVPEMIIDSLIDKIKSGANRGSLIKIMRKMIQKEIKSTKKQITERLK